MRASLATALGLAWRARPAALLGIAAVTLLAGGLPIAITWLTKALVDGLTDRIGGGGPSDASLELVGAGLILAGGLVPASGPLLRYLGQQLQRGISMLTYDRLFARVNGLHGLAAFERPEFHDRLLVAQQAGEIAPGQVVSLGMGLVQSLVTVVGFLLSVLLVSPLLAGLAAVALLPSFVGELRLARRRVEMALRLSPHDRRRLFFARLLIEPEAAKELRLFGVAEHFRGRMLREFETIIGEEQRLDRRALAIQLTSRGLAGVVAAVALVLVVGQALSGELSAGDVVVLLAALAALQNTSSELVSTLADAHHALLLVGEYRRFLESASELPDGDAPVPPLRDAIVLEDVWFRYADDLPWVLEGVTLRIPCGESLGLVGLNGAGKSTLVKLLCRFYDPTRGRILWDGHDLRGLDVAALRERIGAVFQDFMAFDLTAADNVGLGDLAHAGDRARIERAAETAQVGDAVARLPAGWDTMLSRTFGGDDGTGAMLSGGQWQRLAIARMLMRASRDLLILDEPSSGLDVDAEASIQERLREQTRETTTVLISHRLSTVRLADRIVVLGGGRVVESGSHDELIAAAGEYARLFGRQAAGYAAGAGAEPV